MTFHICKKLCLTVLFVSEEVTEDLYDRFLAILTRICQDNFRGIPFNILHIISKILDIYYERVDHLPPTFSSRIISLIMLCGRKFVRNISNEEFLGNIQDSISSLIQVLGRYIQFTDHFSFQIEAVKALTSILMMEKRNNDSGEEEEGGEGGDGESRNLKNDMRQPLDKTLKLLLLDQPDLLNDILITFNNYSAQFLYQVRNFRHFHATGSQLTKDPIEEEEGGEPDSTILSLNQSFCDELLLLVRECSSFYSLSNFMVQHSLLDSISTMLQTTENFSSHSGFHFSLFF